MAEADILYGFQTPLSGNDDTNGMAFFIKQFMSRVWTSALVQVKAVTNTGGLEVVGFVDVQPMVHQIDGIGNSTPHGVIHNVPYMRVQGGANAIILDPQVGDIGLAIFASRDISAVKASRAPNVPGSFRRFDPGDGLYIGGFLNGVPTQYVRFSAEGVEIVSTTQIKLQAPDIQFDGPTHTTGAVTGDGTADYGGEGTFDGHTVGAHTHTQPADSHGDTEAATNTPTG